jgi:hypothetical protein
MSATIGATNLDRSERLSLSSSSPPASTCMTLEREVMREGRIIDPARAPVQVLN